MSGYAVRLIWIVGFAALGIALLTRLLTWRARLPAMSLGAFALYLLLSLAGMGVGLYQRFTILPTWLAAPVEGALLVERVAAVCLVVGMAMREAYLWSGWRLGTQGARTPHSGAVCPSADRV